MDLPRINLCQIKACIGNPMANAEQILSIITTMPTADIYIFPEMSLSGYACDDLWLHPNHKLAIDHALNYLIKSCPAKIMIIVGTPHHQDNKIFNAAAIIHQNTLQWAHKCALPNDSIFREERHFSPGITPKLISFGNINIALLICEDIWQPDVFNHFNSSCDLVICINASPFRLGIYEQRKQCLYQLYERCQAPIYYVNLVGTQDELVFDGGSLIYDHHQVIWQAPFFEPCLYHHHGAIEPIKIAQNQTDTTLLIQAMTTALRDYTNKHHFDKVVIGVSGGIDSALVVILATLALGYERIIPVIMPSKYSSLTTQEDASLLCEQLGLTPVQQSINDLHQQLQHQLTITDHSLADQNIQSRLRAMILMNIANQSNSLVLNTSNKSEIAMGYSTLYGDSIGGYAPIQDLTKTWVYQLCQTFVNDYPALTRIIQRPPSAELKPNQTDEDELWPYSLIDTVIDAWMARESTHSIAQRINRPLASVQAIITRLLNAQFKREQSPIGVKLMPNSFGRSWQFPTTVSTDFLDCC